MNDKNTNDLVAVFERELAGRLEALQAAWQGPARGTQAALEKIQRIAHDLAGSAGAYGYPAVAEAAILVEETASMVLARLGQSGSHLQERLHQQLNLLGAQLAKPEPQHVPLLSGRIKNGRIHTASQRIVIVDDDVAFSRLLAAQLAQFGFQVDLLDDLTCLPAYLAQTSPDLIVMDVLFPQTKTSGPQTIAMLHAQIKGRIPVVFVSASDTMSSRLGAVRANGQAFFAKPFDAAQLIDTIDRLLGLKQERPAYRVLIVEDAVSLAHLYAVTLEQAGMMACVVSKPLQMLEVMENFRPDLILMDLYMPEVSGVELARVIQQHHAYMGVPLIFLSAERDPAKQLAALGQGGDNFLTKPVAPDELVKVVSTRAHHYQAMRSLMLQDSLTGLLNHSRLLEQLDHELRRAQRVGKPLSVAMIDIDHFKSFNDCWGHVVGDHVILSLARLLRERLRSTDIVGRYGGEEFLVIMPDTDTENACRVIEELRSSFAELPQYADQNVFYTTFSAGVAMSTLRDVDRKVIKMADSALFAAKRAGRNRMQIAAGTDNEI